MAEVEEKALQKICIEAGKQTFTCEADALMSWNAYLFLIALLIFALMERRVRQNLAAVNRILDLGYRKVDKPTGMIILDDSSRLV